MNKGNNTNTKRYFIGYCLDGKNSELVDKLIKNIAEKFSVTAALRFPAHMTLFYPFEMDKKTVSNLEKSLSRFAQRQTPFQQKVTGYNCFGKAVWFLDVEQDKVLFDLKRGVVKLMREDFQIIEDFEANRDVHFHITLAYKDVTPEKFRLIGQYLKGQNPAIRSLNIDAITLFEYTGTRWEVAKKFHFDGEQRAQHF